MEEQVNNPLVIRCPQCGGAVNFDILKQEYHCDYCGATTKPDEQKADFKHWKSTHQQRLQQDLSHVKTFSCPTCGAQTLAPADEASATCPFCHNTMIDATFSNNDLPEVIIPFKITLEEAKEKVKAWVNENKGLAAAKTIGNEIDRLTGCYLPYEVVRGCYDGALGVALQEHSDSDYDFKAFLKSTAVNASNDLDNLFLDGIEPFDFDDAREFKFDYLNQQQAKVPNVDAEELNQRIKAETELEIYQTLSHQYHNKEMVVSLFDDTNESAAALLPVYVLKCDKDVAVAVNGQTGKISVHTGKMKNVTKWWWVLPLLASAAVIALAFKKIEDQELIIAVVMFSLILFFGAANARHKKKQIKEILTSPKTEKSHNDTQVQFFAKFRDGVKPATLKFITPRRVFKIIFRSLLVLFLPAIIAIILINARGGNVDFKNLLYGGGLWYLLMVPLLVGKLNTMLYGFPKYIEIPPEGSKRKKPRTKKTRFSLSRFIGNQETKPTKKEVALAVLCFLFLFFGSIYAMCLNS